MMKHNNKIIRLSEIIVTKEKLPVDLNTQSEIPEELEEAGHKDIWDPDVQAHFKKKSSDALQRMTGGLTGRQLGSTLMQTVMSVQQAEKNHIPQLEQLAVQIVKEMFPIAEDQGWLFDVKISEDLDVECDEEEIEPDDSSEPPEVADSAYKRRRIINSMTQGGAVKGAYGLHLYQDAINKMDPKLISNYKKTMDLAFGMYHNQQSLDHMMQQLAQGVKNEGGRNTICWDKEKEAFIIKARAIIFPILLHECIKGVYEVLAQTGFSQNAAKNKEIIKKIDKIENEGDDLNYGPHIVEAFDDFWNSLDIDDGRVKYIFLSKLYAIKGDDFRTFVQDFVMDRLSPQQKKWAEETAQQINQDYKTDDASTSVHGRPDIDI